MLAGIVMASVLYIPTLIALRYFDRREHELWPLVLFAILSVILFFGSVTSKPLGVIDHYLPLKWVVGFIEEFWRVAPLLLIAVFLPPAIGGTRDGLIYGGWGGWVRGPRVRRQHDLRQFPEKGWMAFP